MKRPVSTFPFYWKIGALALPIVWFVFLVGCGSHPVSAGSPSPSPHDAISVAVSPPNITLRIKSSQQFAATVKNTNNSAVTWQVNGITGGNETFGTISADGLYSAPATIPATSDITITAISSADNTKQGQAVVILTALSNNFAYISSPAGDRIQVFAAYNQTLEPISTIAVGSGKHPTALAVHPTGKFLYSLNRGSNDISVFAIDNSSGDLTSAGTAPAANGPYRLIFSPKGDFAYVSCDEASAIAAYAVSPTTGMLTPLSGSPYSFAGRVQGLALSVDGTLLYVANHDAAQIIGLKVNQNDGTLTEMTGSPFPARPGVSSIVATDAYVYTGEAASVSAFRRDSTTGSLTLAASAPTGGNSPELFRDMSTGLLIGVNSTGGGFFAFEPDEGLFSYANAATDSPAAPGGLLANTNYYPTAYVLNPAEGSVQIYLVVYDGAHGPQATVPTGMSDPTGFAITP